MTGMSLDLGAGNSAPGISAGSTTSGASGRSGGTSVAGSGPAAGGPGERTVACIGRGPATREESGGTGGAGAARGDAGARDDAADRSGSGRARVLSIQGA